MNQNSGGTGYKIVALDDQLYGPVELPTLIEWVRRAGLGQHLGL